MLTYFANCSSQLRKVQGLLLLHDNAPPYGHMSDKLLYFNVDLKKCVIRLTLFT